MKTANTLFNRIKILKLNLTKEETKKLGQVIKTEYFKIYEELPSKTVIELQSKTGVSLTRLVAVYPDEFLPRMDKLIQTYHAHVTQAVNYKNSKK